MKLKLGKVFAGRKSTASADIPTVMVSAPLAGDTGMAGAYDPTRAVSVVEQLRAAARGGKAVKQLPLIGHLPTAKQFQYLAAALGTSFVLMLALFGLYAIEARKNAAQIAAATEMQMLAQRLARGGAQSEMGGAGGFDVLQTSRDQFRANLKALSSGGDYRGVSVSEPQNDTVRAAASDLEKRWTSIDGKVDELIAARGILTSLSQAVSNVNQGNQGLLELAEQLATQLSTAGGRGDHDN